MRSWFIDRAKFLVICSCTHSIPQLGARGRGRTNQCNLRNMAQMIFIQTFHFKHETRLSDQAPRLTHRALSRSISAFYGRFNLIYLGYHVDSEQLARSFARSFLSAQLAKSIDCFTKIKDFIQVIFICHEWLRTVSTYCSIWTAFRPRNEASKFFLPRLKSGGKTMANRVAKARQGKDGSAN